MRVLTQRFVACVAALALASAFSINSADAASGSSDPAALTLLHQAEAMAKPSATSLAPAPHYRATVDRGARLHDGTAVMVALAKALPKLDPADQATARAILNPTSRLSSVQSSISIAQSAPTGVSTPVNGEACAGDSGNLYNVDVTADGHFAIFYTLTGNNAITTDYLGDVEAVLANVWNTEINQMGYQAPLSPYSNSTVTPINLCNIATDLYGYCAPASSLNGISYTAACTLRNDYTSLLNPRLDGPDPLAPLKVTAAHEFFHAVQFRQDANEPLWLMEGTAVWMENEVYPDIHDYLQYLLATGIKEPLVPFNVFVDQSSFSSGAIWPFTPYGDFAFFKALSGFLGSPTVVREIWNYLGRHPTVGALRALTDVTLSHKQTLTSVMLNYANWNTLPPHSYPAANLYRPPVWWLHPKLDRSNRVLTGHRLTIRPLANTALAITRGSHVLSTTNLEIGVSGPRGTTGGWFTVRRQQTNGTVVFRRYQIGTRGSVVRIPFNSTVSYVVITLNNVATSGAARYFGVRAKVL
ncbi:MAG: MXAN_6640 family putative metalloprotease [Marmoricola sp.]